MTKFGIKVCYKSSSCGYLQRTLWSPWKLPIWKFLKGFFTWTNFIMETSSSWSSPMFNLGNSSFPHLYQLLTYRTKNWCKTLCLWEVYFTTVRDINESANTLNNDLPWSQNGFSIGKCSSVQIQVNYPMKCYSQERRSFKFIPP